MNRGQSELVGLVLLLGIAILGTATLVGFGAILLQEGQQEIEMQNAENTMSKAASEVGLVGFGNTNSQTVALPSSGSGDYQVVSDVGRIRVEVVNRTGTEEILNVSLGRIEYTNGNKGVSMEAGGVWRREGNYGKMVSPPQFQYRGNTLTLSAVSVTGDGELNREMRMSQVGETEVKSASEANPVRDRNIDVYVTSKYYRGWGEYFESRLNAKVEYFHNNDTVLAPLRPPPEPISVDSAVVARGNLTFSGGGNVVGPVTIGGTVNDYTAVSGPIREQATENTKLIKAATKISQAESELNGNGSAVGQPVTAGSYDNPDGSLFDDATVFDTSGGDISVFVDGDVSTNKDLTIQGDGNVRIYIDGEYDMRGQAAWNGNGNGGNNGGGSTGDTENNVDQLMVYSQSVDRITQFNGVLYTGAFSIDGGGGGSPDSTNFQGALISTADDVEVGGNIRIEYDGSLQDRILQEVDLEYATINYLHVSHSVVKVESA